MVKLTYNKHNTVLVFPFILYKQVLCNILNFRAVTPTNTKEYNESVFISV